MTSVTSGPALHATWRTLPFHLSMPMYDAGSSSDKWTVPVPGFVQREGCKRCMNEEKTVPARSRRVGVSTQPLGAMLMEN